MVNVNLIAERLTAQRAVERMTKVAAFTALFLLVVVSLFGTERVTKIRALNASIAAEQREIKTKGKSKADLDLLRQQVSEKEPVVALLQQARDSERKWCLALRDLTVPLTETITLTDIRSSANMRPPVTMVASGKEEEKEQQAKAAQEVYEGLVVAGTAASHTEATAYARRIEQQPTFIDVYVIYTRMVRQADTDRCRFELYCFIRKVPEEGKKE